MLGLSVPERAAAALAALDLAPPRVLVSEELGLPEPQAGPQTVASESTAQIIFFGGGAGGGKTWWLQRESMRHHRNRRSRAFILRRTLKQAKKPGSLWDESVDMFRTYGASSRVGSTDHLFPSGASVTIGGCEHDVNRYDYDGSQVDFIGFDQVEQFTETMFWYIALSRSRSMAGIPTRIGATANPISPKHKTGGWLSSMLMRGGWVDAETGYAVSEMSGVIKWFYRDQNELHFFESEAEAREAFPAKTNPKTMTFIESKLSDNVKLEEKDPGYRDNLEALPWIERQRLLGRNWKVSTAGGGSMRREWVRRLGSDPSSVAPGGPSDPNFWSCNVRAYDLAGTAESEGHAKDRTATVLGGRAKASGRIIVREQFAGHLGVKRNRELIVQNFLKDPEGTVIRIPQDPAQAGKDQIASIKGQLSQIASDYGRRPPRLVFVPPTGSKLKRCEPFYQDAEPSRMDADGDVVMYGNIDVVEGPYTDDWLNELHHYDGSKNAADDFWDATADMYNEIIAQTSGGRPFVG